MLSLRLYAYAPSAYAASFPLALVWAFLIYAYNLIKNDPRPCVY